MSSHSEPLCAICLETVSRDDVTETSQCRGRHVYHRACIESAVAHGRRICPYNCGGRFSTNRFPDPLPLTEEHDQLDMSQCEDLVVSGQGSDSNSNSNSNNSNNLVTLRLSHEQTSAGTNILCTMCTPAAAQAATQDQTHLVVLAIDCSGSMTGQKLDQTKTLAKGLLKVLADRSQGTIKHGLALLPFNTALVSPVPVTTNIDRLVAALDSLEADGGTSFGPVLTAAQQIFALPKYHGTIKTVIMLTDGICTDLTSVTVNMATNRIREAGGIVNVIGLGHDHDVTMCSQMALKGAGTYNYIPNDEIEKITIAVGEIVGNMFNAYTESTVAQLTVVAHKRALNHIGAIVEMGGTNVSRFRNQLEIKVGRMGWGEERDVLMFTLTGAAGLAAGAGLTTISAGLTGAGLTGLPNLSVALNGQPDVAVATAPDPERFAKVAMRASAMAAQEAAMSAMRSCERPAAILALEAGKVQITEMVAKNPSLKEYAQGLLDDLELAIQRTKLGASQYSAHATNSVYSTHTQTGRWASRSSQDAAAHYSMELA